MAGCGAQLQDLDAAHPDYAARYRSHYVSALRASGLDPERVPLVRFLSVDGTPPGR